MKNNMFIINHKNECFAYFSPKIKPKKMIPQEITKLKSEIKNLKRLISCMNETNTNIKTYKTNLRQAELKLEHIIKSHIMV